MRFPCKNCGVELSNPGVDELILNDVEFFWQECPECGVVRRYSWLRLEQIPEKT